MAQKFTLGTFGDALAALKQGRKVRNREWGGDRYLEIRDPNPDIQVVTAHMVTAWYPQPYELVSNSWETVE